MKIRLLGDRILIKPLPQEEEKDGIVIPEIAREKTMIYKIMQITDNDFNLKVGDNVICSKYCGGDINVNNEICKMVGIDEVLCLLNN